MMEVLSGGISRRKVNLLLAYLLVLAYLDPVSSQFRRRRFRLLPSLASDESREVTSQSQSQAIKIYIYREVLDPETGLSLTWSVNRNLGSISFTVESSKMKSGYVTLALTEDGEVKGSDVVVVGVRDKDGIGIPYVVDMHGVEDDKLARDEEQDWRLDLDDSKKEGEGMRVSIRRNLNTCDEDDMVIGSEQIVILYSQGEDQDVPTQMIAEGTKKIAFIGPESEAKPLASTQCPQGKLSSKSSPASMVTDSDGENTRIIRTASPLEDLVESSTKAGDDDDDDDVDLELPTELEGRSVEYQDPADDRHGYGYVKKYKFWPSLAYARLKMKLLLSKMKFHNKHYLKFVKY